jgi:hypothetical protein
MTKEIISVGFEIPSSYETKNLNLRSSASLSDGDIVIFLPRVHYNEYYTDHNDFQGKTLYNEMSSSDIRDNINHWIKEISGLVKTGKTIFFILEEKKDFYIYKKGNNFKEKEIHNNYFFIPKISNLNIQFHSSKGSKIFPSNEIIKGFYNEFKDLLECETYIEIKEDIDNLFYPLFTTKNKEKILGGVYKFKNNSHFVFLPLLNFNRKEFIERKKDKEYWTDQAMITGTNYINYLIQIDKILKSESNKTPKPSWLSKSEFDLEMSKKIKAKIKVNNDKISKLKNENETFLVELEEQEILKDLLFETGKPLENVVIEALKILGYKAENYDDGKLELDQIILSPEGDRFIGECEGKDNKDIDITKVRQLIDSINQDYFNHDGRINKSPGILFGNSQRLIPPDERTLDFTQKCKDSAKRENLALIKTVDLFEIVKYLKENKDEKFKKECRDTIKKGLGEIIQFPKIKKK